MHTVVILLYSYELRQCTNAQATVPPLCHVIFLQGFTSLIDGGEGEREEKYYLYLIILTSDKIVLKITLTLYFF